MIGISRRHPKLFTIPKTQMGTPKNPEGSPNAPMLHVCVGAECKQHGERGVGAGQD